MSNSSERGSAQAPTAPKEAAAKNAIAVGNASFSKMIPVGARRDQIAICAIYGSQANTPPQTTARITETITRSRATLWVFPGEGVSSESSIELMGLNIRHYGCKKPSLKARDGKTVATPRSLPTRTVGAASGRVTALVDCDAYIAGWINPELPR